MKVKGAATYVADVDCPGVLEAAFVRSPFASATFILPSLPEGVFDAPSLALKPIKVRGPGLAETEWPPLALGRVRFVGEAVAVAVAADRYRAEDLADAVEVEFSPLGEVPLHDS
ncbi:MAG: xanthine dehydrogenase family protein molybdopterin-binding subunit, partial [Candidatus Dormibacteraeota bacterium]|nr:xanthine dehydrogenase family protein molybdopterin-binding subunit [Candidatus Dormibacteraeota bacterium]